MTETKKPAQSKPATNTDGLDDEKRENRAAQLAESKSVVGNDGRSPVQLSGLDSVPNSVLNPAFVAMEGE